MLLVGSLLLPGMNNYYVRVLEVATCVPNSLI